MKLARPLVVASAVVFAGLVVLAVGIRLRVAIHGRCDDSRKELARDARGYVVESTFSACATLSTTLDGTVELISPHGHREVIARFVPWDGRGKRGGTLLTGPFDPSAAWVSPNTLRVSLGVIGALTEKRTNVDGIDITYDVVEVDPSR